MTEHKRTIRLRGLLLAASAVASVTAFAAPASASVPTTGSTSASTSAARVTTTQVTGSTVSPHAIGCGTIFNGQAACVLTNGSGLGMGGAIHVCADNICKTNLIMQYDGNLVDYDENGHARWASSTVGSGDHAVMQSDGNFVVYTSGERPVWASNTCCHSNYWLALQEDGNIVIYNGSNQPVWATGTNH